MRKLKTKKEYGEWKYEKIAASENNDLEFDVWKLYKIVNGEPKYVGDFAFYDDMVYYTETGIKI